MPRIQIGEIALNVLEHGAEVGAGQRNRPGEAPGDRPGDGLGAETLPVLAIHGNLGCAHWLDLAVPLLPSGLRVIASEWRGCGDSDKPEPLPDFANYRMAIHAADHLALLDALGIERCHLYGHSTGGIIISHLLTLAPERFAKVLLLDPVSPFGLELHPEQLDVLRAMQAERDLAFAGLATAAPTLFEPSSLAAGQQPQFAASATHAQRELFALLVDKTRILSDGIWFGTPHDLGREWAEGGLAERMPAMRHEHLILYGDQDLWIPAEHLERMAERLPNARLERFAEVGHSMNLEQPERFARIFADYFMQL
ncbi:MAG: alpha/beta hydrolase [Chromatiaceae bacterium]|nr:alpha/beta hydrolase [Chromatiaceae bacterium]MCF7996737.1 alpha/beta hydrolase [Chromatiaceae bacterium]